MHGMEKAGNFAGCELETGSSIRPHTEKHFHLFLQLQNSRGFSTRDICRFTGIAFQVEQQGRFVFHQRFTGTCIRIGRSVLAAEMDLERPRPEGGRTSAAVIPLLTRRWAAIQKRARQIAGDIAFLLLD